MKKILENQAENKKSMDFLRGFLQGSLKKVQENQEKSKQEFESKISQVVKLETQMLDFLQNSKINEVHRDLKASKQSIDKDHMAINDKIQKMDENLKKVIEMEQQNIHSTRNVDTSSPEVKVTISNSPDKPPQKMSTRSRQPSDPPTTAGRKFQQKDIPIILNEISEKMDH